MLFDHNKGVAEDGRQFSHMVECYIGVLRNKPSCNCTVGISILAHGGISSNYMLSLEGLENFVAYLNRELSRVTSQLNPPPPVTEQKCIACGATDTTDRMIETTAGWLHDGECAEGSECA